MGVIGILRHLCCSGITLCVVKDNMVNIYVERESFSEVIRVLRMSRFLRYTQLLDIICVDKLVEGRLELMYVVVSLQRRERLFLRIEVLERSMMISMMNEYKSSGWLEREVWDMFGLFFYGNNDLRRILTDYGFEGHPLRKSFPLGGYFEVSYLFKW